jgi:hypothetical protein
MLLIKILVPMQQRLPTADISRTFESYDKLKRRIGRTGGGEEGAVSTEQSPGLGGKMGRVGFLNFLLPGVLGREGGWRSSVGTELPAALGQECVCSSTQANTLAVDGFPPWRCRFVCDSASRESSVAGD